MRGTYIALSHVWGAQIHNKLEMKLLEKWREGIDVRLLPRSFRDAITVTRKLGFRYIWIDALCIVQDSPQDWQRESSKMGNVFKNAFLTIAVSATAQSPDGFLTRKPRYDSSCKLELLSNSGTSCGHVLVKPQASPKGKIDSRAWCLQENVLSTRVLTFASEECFFECRKKYRVSESGVYSFQDSRYLSTGGDLIQALSRAPNEFQNSECLDKSGRERICQQIARLWYAMIGDSDDHITRSGYGNRDLTHTSDKLPALSGLAHEIHRIIQCRYLAGIWECYLVEGLLWRRVLRRVHSGLSASGPSIPQKLGDPDAPSWSWATCNGPLQYPSHFLATQSTDVINIIDSGTTPAGSDPMGRVSSGWITLNGPISEIRCIRGGDNSSYQVTSPRSQDLSHEAKETRTAIENILAHLGVAPPPEDHIAGAIFDDDDRFSSSVTCLLFCMPTTNCWAYGLMLQSTGRDGEYRRVGFWQATEARPDLSSLWAGLNRRTITLI
ncbi:hypothetical protein EG329_000959 [Mollisiaceae sp. DMI_Dod_QoI]|nr:hypothetical protein EG329_000959 [Helotiales sp. DMI_Dod_QoI]